MFEWLRVMASRIYGSLTIRRLDHDFEQELEAHLALLTEENIRRGLLPEEARRDARLRLGHFPWIGSSGIGFGREAKNPLLVAARLRCLSAIGLVSKTVREHASQIPRRPALSCFISFIIQIHLQNSFLPSTFPLSGFAGIPQAPEVARP